MTDETAGPPSNSGVFHFGDDRPSFEDLVRSNGVDTWSGRQLADLLGYSSWESFQGVIDRAQQAVIAAKHNVLEHFIQEHENGVNDLRLTKFACLMVAMNGSPSKPAVAHAQAYFARFMASVSDLQDTPEGVERLLIRSELATENKALGGIAKSRGAITGLDFAMFHDAGYMGMYNMTSKQLAQHRGLTGTDIKRLFDFMGSRELGANLFRATETRAKIESEGITGNEGLQEAHRSVGREVRNSMMRNTGDKPEALPGAQDIKKVKSALKKTGKRIDQVEIDPEGE